ncbi:MAG: TIGR01777 family oxidoreductase [Dokdonella sp.]
MHYLITGGTGFIGKALCASLIADQHRVTVLTRNVSRAKACLPTSAMAINRLDEAANVDVIVNLAGENLTDGRWSDERKQAFLDSRIGTTRQLNHWIVTQDPRPRAMISGSAIGWYGARGDEKLPEESSPGDDFAAKLCLAWEAEAIKAEALGVRVCRLRTGVVLAADGGALAKMLPPFKFGLGGPMGDGKQWMSWITRHDLVRMIRWLAETDAASGAYNGTAPNPVTNADFADALAKALHRPAIIRTPAIALKLMFGEMANMLLTGQRVMPARATSQGFLFDHPELSGALAAVL